MGLPSSACEVIDRGEKRANGYTPGRWRNAKTYLLPPDASKPSLFRYRMHVGKDVHYEDDAGAWRTINLDWRVDASNAGEFITDQNDVYTRITRFGVAVWDRKRRVGVRWSTTQRPVVDGRRASFPKDGLEWSWSATTSGLKLESAPVIAARGPQTYEWRYLVVDLSHLDGFNLAGTLEVDAGGNLVGDGFVTPRAYAIGANGVQYDCGKWQVVPAKTRAVAFAFDDSTLPPDAFPYVIDPTTTFASAVSADDGNFAPAGSAAYPPPAPTSGAGDTTLTSINAQRDLQAGFYTVRVGLVRWDTGALPDTATVTGATLRGNVTLLANTDVRSLTADWYASSNWPIDYQDWILAAQTSAQAGLALSSFTLNADNDIPLANAAANVSLTGYTGLRLHISGGQPTGTNRFAIASFDHTTLPKPRLIIDYTDVTAPSPDVTIASLVATSTTLASSPIVTTTRSITINAVTSTASAVATAPVVTTSSSTSVSIIAAIAQATTAANVPTVSTTAMVNVISAVATATTIASSPVVSAIRNVDIASIVVTASVAAFAPTINAGGSVMIAAVVSSVSATAYAPSIAAQRSVTIQATIATSSTLAPSPNVAVQQNIAVQVVVATVSASAFAPTISTGINVSVVAVVAIASASGFAPTIAAQRQVNIVVTVATATTTSFAPSLYITGQSLRAFITVLSMLDSITATSLSDRIVLVPLDSTLEVSSMSRGPYLVGEAREISIQLAPRYDVTLPGTITSTWTATRDGVPAGNGASTVLIVGKAANVTALVPFASVGQYIVTFVVNVGNEVIEKQEYITVKALK